MTYIISYIAILPAIFATTAGAYLFTQVSIAHYKRMKKESIRKAIVKGNEVIFLTGQDEITEHTGVITYVNPFFEFCYIQCDDKEYKGIGFGQIIRIIRKYN